MAARPLLLTESAPTMFHEVPEHASGAGRRISRRRVLQGAAALAAAALLARRARADEPAAFDTLDLDWADPRRQRPLPVRLYLPRAEGPLPLMVFSHGIGGSRFGYRWLGQHLAASGIASLHPQHVGSDRQVWFGNVFEIFGRLQEAAREQEALARALDVRFALDTLLQGEHGARIDTRRIVAGGHSYGANTTLLVAGARVEREGRTVELRDERVRAALVISAPPFYGEADPKRVLAGVTLPSLHVTATDDVIRVPGYWSGASDRLAVFDATASPAKWLAVYAGGSHSMFTDRAGTGGVALNPQVKAATRELTLAFLRQVFDGDASALAAWPERHAAILARFAEVRV
jgi:dienelactone hydrolase